MFPRLMLGRLKLFYTELGQNFKSTKEFLLGKKFAKINFL